MSELAYQLKDVPADERLRLIARDFPYISLLQAKNNEKTRQESNREENVILLIDKNSEKRTPAQNNKCLMKMVQPRHPTQSKPHKV